MNKIELFFWQKQLLPTLIKKITDLLRPFTRLSALFTFTKKLYQKVDQILNQRKFKTFYIPVVSVCTLICSIGGKPLKF